MELKLLVVSEAPETWTSKSGQTVNAQKLTCLDAESGPNRCASLLEYNLSEDEKSKFSGKLSDKIIRLAVREIVPLGKRLRLRGAVLEVVK